MQQALPPNSASKDRLRLWLRLLRASRTIEAEVRERLRLNHSVTLPQFDVMAAVNRYDNGVNMSEISRFLMVSNGNVTGIVDRLVNDGLATRSPAPGDRRKTIVQFTDNGRQTFSTMARDHETWIDELLSGFESEEALLMARELERLAR